VSQSHERTQPHWGDPGPVPGIDAADTVPSTHFAAVDGLRGIACLGVVAHHCYLHAGRYQWPSFEVLGHPVVLSRLLFYGNAGVELFFVISGFCLAFPLLQRSKKEGWKRWFLKRAYRILPPYYASALLFWGMNGLLRIHPFRLFGMTSPPAGPVELKGVLACFTLLNAYFNPSYWTLVLEARWYLIFPLLIWLWARAGATMLFAACVFASAVGFWLSTVSPKFVFLTANVLLYLPLFASGMLLARWTAKRETPRWLVRAAPWGLAASVLLVAFGGPSDSGDGPVPRLVAYGMVAFFWLLSALNSPRFSSFARLPVFVRVGAFSYSLYLIHEPIVHLAFTLFGQLHLTPPQSFLVYECGVLPFCVGVGYLFFRLVERPLLRRAGRIFKRTPVSSLRPSLLGGTANR